MIRYKASCGASSELSPDDMILEIVYRTVRPDGAPYPDEPQKFIIPLDTATALCYKRNGSGQTVG